jgi:hypothetical protein
MADSLAATATSDGLKAASISSAGIVSFVAIAGAVIVAALT